MYKHRGIFSKRIFACRLRRGLRCKSLEPRKLREVQIFVSKYSGVPNTHRLPNKCSHGKISSKLINLAPKISLKWQKRHQNKDVAL